MLPGTSLSEKDRSEIFLFGRSCTKNKKRSIFNDNVKTWNSNAGTQMANTVFPMFMLIWSVLFAPTAKIYEPCGGYIPIIPALEPKYENISSIILCWGVETFLSEYNWFSFKKMTKSWLKNIHPSCHGPHNRFCFQTLL